MTRLAAIVALVAVSACGGNGAMAPSTSPSPTVFSISGRVSGNNRPLAGASVRIQDGIYSGQVRDTTNDGFYDFRDLAASSMSLEASYPGYSPHSKTVMATNTNQSVDFVISDH